jgi:Mg2+/Co2+ transporter CorB
MVVISAYFSGSETGMMTLNRYRLRHRLNRVTVPHVASKSCCASRTA